MSPPPGPELIARLLDEHGDALTLWAAQWTAEPDDAVQDALVELARRRTPPDSPVAWLYHVTRRRAMNRARGRRRRREREAAAFRGRLGVSPAATDPASAAALADAVAVLPDALREALVLRHWGGLTLAEIGAALGVSTATAARRVDAATQQLRELWLEPCEPTDKKR